MSADEKKYFLRWKGVESGPYPIDKIKTMFERGKVGLLHEIRAEDTGNWSMLKNFADATFHSSIDVSSVRISADSKSSLAEEISEVRCSADSSPVLEDKFGNIKEPADDSERKGGGVARHSAADGIAKVSKEMSLWLVYGLCGAAFISLWLYLACIVFAFLSIGRGDRAMAIRIAVLSTIMATLGFLFFGIFIPSVSA